MFINFAMVDPDPDCVEQSFRENGRSVVRNFLIRYEHFFGPQVQQEILALDNLTAQLRLIFDHATVNELKIYLFIDEYDNFTNTILSNTGERAYYAITCGEGFFRHFFNLLKGATGGQILGLTRLFITSVSPITMDDVTSGFNIGTNISIDGRFNEMVGFTEAEVRTMLAYYEGQEMLPLGSEASLTLMQTWYNHYRFGRRAKTSMYNSDMILYFLLNTNADDGVPDEMIDMNIRIDYNKLRHLMAVDNRLNGNFSLLKTIIEEEETTALTNPSFPLDQLLNRENFVSLLYYFGLLSMAGSRDDKPLLQIPSRTVKDLMYGYMRRALADVDVFKLDLWHVSKLMDEMAYRGDWRPFFAYLNEAIQEQASVRDHLNGEKVLQGFLIAFLNMTHNFLTWSEREMEGGFVDLYLNPSSPAFQI